MKIEIKTRQTKMGRWVADIHEMNQPSTVITPAQDYDNSFDAYKNAIRHLYHKLFKPQTND